MDLRQILDAYVRRPPGATRTIGTLLGWISLDAQTSSAECWRNIDGEVWSVPQSSWYFLIYQWSSLPSSRVFYFCIHRRVFVWTWRDLNTFGEAKAAQWISQIVSQCLTKQLGFQLRLSCWQRRPLTFKIRVRNERGRSQEWFQVI